MKEIKVLQHALLALLVLCCTGSAWALTAEITDITLGPPADPLLVQITVDSDVPEMPLSAFSVTENGIPMELEPECFSMNVRPVDVVFVIDRSFSMEDNIDTVASKIEQWVDGLPDNLDFKFGLVLYGQTLAPYQGCGAYPGAPKNETTDSLMSAASIVARLQAIAATTLAGGQEPAYHALQCALETTQWRNPSERYIILVSDENADSCTFHGAIPNIDRNDLIQQFHDNDNTHFYGWINYNIACDCYDYCEPPRPPCSILQPFGCESGYEDFRPIADATGGNTRSIQLSFGELLDFIGEEILSTYILCYHSECCIPDVLNTVALTVDFNAETANDSETFIRTDCPTAANPVVACYPGNPATFAYGAPVVMCATVTDADNNIDWVSGRYITETCNDTLLAVLADGRWCITIPPSCTQTCQDIQVVFTVRDECGAVDRDTCYLNGADNPPVVSCWAGNPTSYNYGGPLTMCATVSDADNNIDWVSARYIIGTCNDTLLASFVDGRWCATIPPACTQFCSDAMVIFTARDECGFVDRDTCYLDGTANPPVISCYTGNPTAYEYGEPLTMCATIADPDNNIQWVSGRYQIGTCNDTLLASLVDGRWCITVPASCTQSCNAGQVIFTVRDLCGGVDRDTCYLAGHSNPPVVSCLPTVPSPYVPGQPLEVCASFTDADNDIVSTYADYVVGECSGSLVPQFEGGTTGCITIPAECTLSCGTATVRFIAVDECGNRDTTFCTVPGPNPAPDPIVCYTGNPINFTTDFTPVTICVTASPLNSIVSVSAVYTTSPGGCLAVVEPALEGPADRWCITVPGACITPTVMDVSVVFTAVNACGATSTVTCQVGREELPPDECCWFCEVVPPVTFHGVDLEVMETTPNVVIQFVDNKLKLHWNEIPDAAYYNILRGDISASAEDMRVVGNALGGLTEWSDASVSTLPRSQAYMVQPMKVVSRVARVEADRGRWEMNEGSGDYTADMSGNGFDALRWLNCPPTWGHEINECDVSTDYMHFEGFDGHPGCAEHLRVENDDQWYADRFQLWTCIRIFEEPTIQTGPYYIISNNTFSTHFGGFALRIDPAWIMVGGVREYHNRVTAMVWNETLDGWMTLQSPPPSLPDPTRWSVPLNEWATITWVVDGPNSMLLINGVVVAVGNQIFESGNNGAPLIIGAGYRHSTYPIEYPFRGDIDCLRITSLDID